MYKEPTVLEKYQISQQHLMDVAALALADAAGMWNAAADQAKTFHEATNTCTASMIECFSRIRSLMAVYDERWLPSDQLIVFEQMEAFMRTITAAGVVLGAMYREHVKVLKKRVEELGGGGPPPQES